MTNLLVHSTSIPSFYYIYYNLIPSVPLPPPPPPKPRESQQGKFPISCKYNLEHFAIGENCLFNGTKLEDLINSSP